MILYNAMLELLGTMMMHTQIVPRAWLQIDLRPQLHLTLDSVRVHASSIPVLKHGSRSLSTQP